MVIAESDLNDPRVTQPRECGGWGADAQWSDDFHHALHALLTGERSGYYNDFGTMQHLATALGEVFVYAGRPSAYRGRVHGRAVGRADGWRFVVAAQNHDQIGNRAKGDRLTALVSPGCLKIAAALLLTSPFVPLLFQGEEWAASTPFTYFTAHENQHLGEQVRKGRHDEFAAFGWDAHDIPDPQSPDTFRRARLQWDELVQPSHAAMLEWYRRLIALRRQTPALRDGDYRACGVRFNEGGGWIVVNRKGIATVWNLSTRALDVPLGAAARVMLASDAGIEISGDAVRMVPEGAAIVSIDSSATPRPGF